MKNTTGIHLATVAFFASLMSLGLLFIMMMLLALSNSAALLHLRDPASYTPHSTISNAVLWTILSSVLWLAWMTGVYLNWRKASQASV